jgi:hypothetical protein
LPEIVRKNGLLIAAAAFMVALFVTMTMPALERDRKLAEVERQKIEQLEKLRREAEAVKLQQEALEQGDPALQERAVRMAFQHGLPLPLISAPATPEDVAPR